MSVRRLHPEQPASFRFSRENLAWAKEQLKKFPKGRQASAIIPLMWRAQEQHEGWLPEPAIRYIADMLDMPYIRALEVATFYTMFQLQPVGKKAHVQVCGTTPCMLRGAGDMIEVCKRRIAANPHEVSEDGDFSWEEVECLGACVNAPMVQIWKDTYEDLTAESFEAVLDAFAKGKTPKPGPQNGRHASEPEGGAKTLIDPAITNGASVRKARTATPAAKAKPIAKAATKPAPTGKPNSRTGEEKTSKAQGKSPEKAVEVVADKNRPQGLDAPREGKADNLKMISGVGPKIEGILHSLGIYHFDQIAKWKKAECEWVDGHLKFKGRIIREDWVKQARALAKGGAAEYERVFGKKPR